jgi:hypothetical protein
LRLSTNPPIGKAFAFDLAECRIGALRVSRFAMAKAEVKLGHIALQVRFADMLIRAD